MVRFKNRYLTIEIRVRGKKNLESFTLKSNSLQRAIEKKVEELHGDFGVAAVKFGLHVKYCNEKTKIALIRCRHGPHRLVQSVLPFITEINGVNIIIHSLYTGATMKKCFKHIIQHQTNALAMVWANLKSDDERRKLQEELMNLPKDLTCRDEGNKSKDIIPQTS